MSSLEVVSDLQLSVLESVSLFSVAHSFARNRCSRLSRTLKNSLRATKVETRLEKVVKRQSFEPRDQTHEVKQES